MEQNNIAKNNIFLFIKTAYHIKDKYYKIEIENLEYKAILIIIYKHEEGKDKKCFEATSNLFSAFYDKLRIKKI
jgi:hypothetical protein